ncbi:MAG: tetratricopeptide repeat protein [Myxococcales bacterium]|nr:tetratricopeptide repeat protein [Myxococcales bacterium]
MFRALTATSLLVVACILPACGGGGASTRAELATTPKAKTATGDVIVDSTGQGVTKAAHANWLEGKEKFAAYDKEGWNPSRCDEVASTFKSANAAQAGKFAEAIYMAGAAMAKCGQDDEANGLFKQALNVNPKLCEARSAVGVAHLEAGRLSQAEAEFTRAKTDDSTCAPAYVNLAIIQRQQGGKEEEEALKNLRRALAFDSDNLSAYNEMALLYLDRARKGKKEALDLGAVVCRQAQLLDPNYAPIYNTWGLISIENSDIIEALRFFERAAQLDPKMFEAHMNFGFLTHSFRGYQDAQQAFAKAVALRPNSYEAHIGLGAALRGLGKHSEAEAEYQAALKIDANRPEAYLNLGILYQDYKTGQIPDLETAKKYYTQFVARADKGRFKDELANVERTCSTKQSRRRKSTDCRPGRLQNIDTALDALRAAEAMRKGK